MNTLSPRPPSPTPTATATPPLPPALRALRIVALLGLAVIFSLIFGLALFSLVPVFHGSFSFIALVSLTADTETLRRAGFIAVGLLILVTAAILAAAWKMKLRSWWWIGGGYLAAAPVLAYLATDDPALRHPITLDELAPAFAGADKSFEVLMRYGRNHPLGKSFVEMPSIVAGKSAREPGPWRNVILANRAQFQSRWAELAPLRAWWSELDAFERIGDLTPGTTEAEVLAFQPVRTYSQTGCAIAGLLALDGRGDEAIDTVLPLIRVGRKLQPSARTLVRLMIGIVIERMALETAGFVLDHATVSPAARARLAAVLAGGNAEAGARRLLLVDYVMTMEGFGQKPLGDLLTNGRHRSWIRHALNLVSPFVYNPRRTFNLYGHFITDLADLLARRDTATFSVRERVFFEQEARPHFKNFMGAVFVREILPAYNKVSESYWKTYDERTRLAARAAQP